MTKMFSSSMTSCKSMLRLLSGMSFNQFQLKRFCVDCHRNVLERGLKRLALIRRPELVLVEEHCRKHDQVSFGQGLSHTDARAHRKRDEFKGMILEFSVSVDPAIWIEFMRILEIFRICVYTVYIAHNHGISGYGVFT